VEGLEEAAEEEVVVVAGAGPQGDLPDAHQAVPLVQARRVAHWAVPGLEALPRPQVVPLVLP
jgi:hypothetical protein